MGFTYKQHAIANPTMGGGTTGAVTINGVSAASLLVLYTLSVDSRTLSGVSDGTNTWQDSGTGKDVSGTNFDFHQPAYALNVPSGSYTITVTLNATSTTLWLVVVEYASIATSSALDQAGGNSDGGSAGQSLTVPAAALTTAAVPELWLACGYASALSGRDFNAVSGWTRDVQETNAGAGPYFSVWSQESNSATSAQITLTTNPNNQFYAGFLLAFKEAAAAVSPSTGLPDTLAERSGQAPYAQVLISGGLF